MGEMRAMGIADLAEMLGIGRERGERDEAEYMARLVRLIEIGFGGDDADARAVRHFLAQLQEDAAFTETDQERVSRPLAKALEPFMEEGAKLYSRLGDLAAVRCGALGIDAMAILSPPEEGVSEKGSGGTDGEGET